MSANSKVSALALLISCAACGASKTATVPVPEEPEVTLRAFMTAVQANDLRAMSNLWGSSKGPASSYMDRSQLEQRLTIIQVYLATEQYEILPPGLSAHPGSQERAFSVRLTRRGCTATVPVTLVRYQQGWLVSAIDLASAGNPARACRGSTPGTTR